jgi:hypothetical protein
LSEEVRTNNHSVVPALLFLPFIAFSLVFVFFQLTKETREREAQSPGKIDISQIGQVSLKASVYLLACVVR